MLAREVGALLTLKEGEETIKDLAEALGTSYQRASQITQSLVLKGFAKKTDGHIQLAETAQATLLRAVSNRYDAAKLLTDSAEDVAIALLGSHDMRAIQNKTGLSYWTIRRSLNRLMETGAVAEKDGVITLADDRELQLFLRLWRDERQRRLVEPYAEVLYTSPTLTLKRVPQGKPASGSLTAFSTFPRYGVALRTVYDYYTQSEGEPGPEEVLTHALAVSTNPVERTECAVFYAKNRPIIDILKLRRMAKRLGVHYEELELENYVRNLTLSEPSLFLPWNEFAEKARLYGIDPEALKPPPPTGLLEELARRLSRPLNLFILGGEAMRIRGLKMATKDIDVVVEDAEALSLLRETLLPLGYEELTVDEQPEDDRRINPSAILVRDPSPRFDIFVRRIADTLTLSETMKERSTPQNKDRLRMHVLSNEDLLLLKSVTGREGDIQDMTQLARAPGFNWRTVLEEMLAQEKDTDQQLCMMLLESVEALQMRTGIKAPIHHRLENHVLDHTILELVKQGRASTTPEIMKYMDYPDYRIKSSIKRLKDRGELLLINDQLISRTREHYLSTTRTFRGGARENGQE
jgi:predicted transcriptional regulator